MYSIIHMGLGIGLNDIWGADVSYGINRCEGRLSHVQEIPDYSFHRQITVASMICM